MLFLRQTIFVSLFVLVLFLTSVTEVLGERLWKPGNFEVYIFDVGQADSQFIVSPSGKTLLIDVGESNWKSGETASIVADKIRQIMGSNFNHIDYILATHLHTDHIGYIGYGGIWALLEKHGFTVGKLIDRNAGTWNDNNQDSICDIDTEITWHNAGTTSGTSKKWVCYVTDLSNAQKLSREIAQIDSTTQIDLGQNIIVKIIQVDAFGIKMEDGQTDVKGDHTQDTKPPSENDYSITLKISYDKLDYVTGGDTDGQYDASSSYKYNDIESIIAPKIGKIEVLRVNHHGSKHSSNSQYLSTLDPDISIISCGTDNKYGHPDQDILNSLLSTSRVYITERCEIHRNYGTSILVNGDIVLKSNNGEDYIINGTSYKAGDNVPTNFPPLYSLTDIKINEVLPAPRSVYEKEWIELYNPTPQDIDISGAKIDDVQNSGGSPYIIPQGSVIQAKGYWIFETANYFNNAGDEVRFLAVDNSLIDNFTYSSTAYDQSWARLPDGGSWSTTMISAPTKELTNE